MKAAIPFLNTQLPFKDASIQKAFVAKAETQSSTKEGFQVLWQHCICTLDRWRDGKLAGGV